MKFIDEATITIQSGNGGNGCLSFRREKFIPHGGPDGGDGGKGGDVIIKATNKKRTLYHFKYKQNFKAKNGSPGQGRQKSGKNGESLIIEVPVGTVVINSDIDEVLKDFTSPEEIFIAARGGRGGKGNTWFATSTHQTPRFSQPGESGQNLTLKLDLKLIADIGIIGMPNAGKSSLLSVLSSARPKIADYPFTTLSPNLGVVKIDGKEPIIVADIPGLIEGAHEGVGLGIKFLRHIERTSILIHLIDASAIDTNFPLHAYETVNKELALYDIALGQKTQIIVLNKSDIPSAKEKAIFFCDALKDKKIILISAMTGEGIEELKDNISKAFV